MDGTDRLTPTGPESALRRLQMSEAELFVFVEGVEADRFVVGSICEKALVDAPLTYATRAAADAGPGGGKGALLTFFAYLAEHGRLCHTFEGKTTAAVFCLDKDIDDIRGVRQYSPHAVYTEHYDIQSYIYRHGDLVMGAAAAGSLDPQQLRGELTESLAWCRAVAGRWQEWVAICVFARRTGLDYRGYGRPSPLNEPPDAAADLLSHDSEMVQLREASGLSGDEFTQAFGRTAALVKRYYGHDKQDRVFKGKWYTRILAAAVARLVRDTKYQKAGFEKRVASAVAATLDFTAPWTQYLAGPLRTVAGMLRDERDG